MGICAGICPSLRYNNLVCKGENHMPDLLIPEGEELNFHSELISDTVTMRGIRILNETDPENWKNQWTDEDMRDHCYRLIYCEGCGYSVGEVSYRKTSDDTAELWLLILGDLREEGYGAAVLKQIAEIAGKNGIRKFEIHLPADHPHRSFFEKRHFTEAKCENEIVTLSAETAVLGHDKCCTDVCRLHQSEK